MTDTTTALGRYAVNVVSNDSDTTNGSSLSMDYFGDVTITNNISDNKQLKFILRSDGEAQINADDYETGTSAVVTADARGFIQIDGDAVSNHTHYQLAVGERREEEEVDWEAGINALQASLDDSDEGGDGFTPFMATEPSHVATKAYVDSQSSGGIFFEEEDSNGKKFLKYQDSTTSPFLEMTSSHIDLTARDEYSEIAIDCDGDVVISSVNGEGDESFGYQLEFLPVGFDGKGPGVYLNSVNGAFDSDREQFANVQPFIATEPSHAATKAYVDQLQSYLRALSDVTGARINKITKVTDTGDSESGNKIYEIELEYYNGSAVPVDSIGNNYTIGYTDTSGGYVPNRDLYIQDNKFRVVARSNSTPAVNSWARIDKPVELP